MLVYLPWARTGLGNGDTEMNGMALSHKTNNTGADNFKGTKDWGEIQQSPALPCLGVGLGRMWFLVR